MQTIKENMNRESHNTRRYRTLKKLWPSTYLIENISVRITSKAGWRDGILTTVSPRLEASLNEPRFVKDLEKGKKFNCSETYESTENNTI